MKPLIQKDIGLLMFKAVLFTVAKIWKQPVSINGWMDKENVVSVHTSTMEYCSDIKKNEILPFATTSMEFESFMLSKIS